TVDWKRNAVQVAGTAAIGLAAGLAAVGFHKGMIAVSQLVIGSASHQSYAVFAVIVLVAITAGAFVTGIWMKNFAPDAPGSGIPQVKEAYHEGRLDFSWNLIWVKFFGGILSIGTGSSLGREGPT